MLVPFLHNLLGTTLDLIEKPLEDYIELETTDIPFHGHADSECFVTGRRDLCTILHVNGTRDIRSPDDRIADVQSLVRDLKAQMGGVGHAIEFNYRRDPDRGGPVIKEQLQGARAAAEAIGLNLTRLFDAQEEFLSKRAVAESYHLAIWTLPIAMSRVELRDNLDEAREKAAKWPGDGAKDAQRPFLSLEGMRSRHASFVFAVQRAYRAVGVETEIQEVHEAGRSMHASLWPGEDATSFSLSLPGDPLPIRAPARNDPSAILWPKMGRQFAVESTVDRVNWETARFGSMLVGSIDVTIGPEAPIDFSILRDRLARSRVPFRLSMRVRSGGDKQVGFGAHLAPFAALFGEGNRRIMKSLERARRVADAECTVTWQLSASTWAPSNQPALIQTRLAELKQCLQQWGPMQVRSMSGDPIQGALSSCLGIQLGSTAETGYAPLGETLYIAPHRAASPWKRGSVPFLRADGAVYPYEEGSSILPYTFTLIFAQMGAGKSVLLARLVFGNILAAGTDKLPFIAFLDVGPGSAGIVETLRESLPTHRRNEVSHAKLTMDQRHAINIFDTPLGCRYPPPDQLAMIEDAISVLATPAEALKDGAQEGLASLVRRLITDMYRYRDDRNPDAHPNRYDTNTDTEVDRAIEYAKINVVRKDGTMKTWWNIVDDLFAANEVRAAQLAQRYAVPTSDDLPLVGNDEALKTDFEAYTAKNGKPLLSMVVTEIKTSLSNYKICRGPTRFEPTARAVALDLQDVLGRGDSPAARKQTAVIYTWCMVALTRRWWLEPRDIAAAGYIPEAYRRYHIALAEDVSTSPKILIADEFHETATSPSTRSAVVKLVRKGRKYRIRVILASQMLQDFDNDMRQLASSIIALSADDDTVITKMKELFGLREAQCDALRQLGRRDPMLGTPMFLIVKAKHGVFSQLIYNCMSPMELWSVATNPREVRIRRMLTEKVGFVRAIELLSVYQPFLTQSADHEIERRIQINLEKQCFDQASEANVIEAIVNEVIENGRIKPSLSIYG